MYRARESRWKIYTCWYKYFEGCLNFLPISSIITQIYISLLLGRSSYFNSISFGTWKFNAASRRIISNLTSDVDTYFFNTHFNIFLRLKLVRCFTLYRFICCNLEIIKLFPFYLCGYLDSWNLSFLLNWANGINYKVPHCEELSTLHFIYTSLSFVS